MKNLNIFLLLFIALFAFSIEEMDGRASSKSILVILQDNSLKQTYSSFLQQFECIICIILYSKWIYFNLC